MNISLPFKIGIGIKRVKSKCGSTSHILPYHFTLFCCCYFSEQHAYVKGHYIFLYSQSQFPTFTGQTSERLIILTKSTSLHRSVFKRLWPLQAGMWYTSLSSLENHQAMQHPAQLLHLAWRSAESCSVITRAGPEWEWLAALQSNPSTMKDIIYLFWCFANFHCIKNLSILCFKPFCPGITLALFFISFL